MSKDFFTAYAQLIALLPNRDAPHSPVASLGPLLPKLAAPMPGEKPKKTKDVAFRSIKPPYKFTHSVSVNESTTVFALKQRLVEDVAALATDNIPASNIKFMLKAKVLADTTPVLAIEGAVTVMVTKPEVKVEEPRGITEATWSKIEELLARDVGDAAAGIVEKFRGLVELD